MADPSKIAGALKAALKAMPAAEREANLAKMLESSQLKDRLYHGSLNDIKEFKPGAKGLLGPGTYLSPSPAKASGYAKFRGRIKGDSTGENVMPVYAQAENPYYFNNDPLTPITGEHIEKLKAMGHDAIILRDPDGNISEVNILNPRQIKSAIGNRGTYDIKEPDVNKADGGKITGGLRKALEAATAPRRTLTPAEARQLIPGPKAPITPVLPAAEREAGLQKFLEPSTEKGRFYHGANRSDLKQIKTGKQLWQEKGKNLDMEPWETKNRGATFISPSPGFANSFAIGPVGSDIYGPTIYPVRAQVTNPWDYDNPKHLKAATDKYLEMFPAGDESNIIKYKIDQLPKAEEANWGGIENAKMQAVIEALGHDSFYVKEAGVKNLGIYDPRKIKSDTGNKGYYDVTKPDLNEAQGGVIHMADGGKMMRGIMGALSKAREGSQSDQAAKAIGKAAQSAGMNSPVTANKPLTGLQDFHTSLQDQIRQQVADKKEMIESMPFKYDKGHRVFTESSAAKNKPPYTIMYKYPVGNNPVREGPGFGKVVKDPDTGKAKRTPYEPGYMVRHEDGDEWAEFMIPESAIKGQVERKGGVIHRADGGKIVGGLKKAMAAAAKAEEKPLKGNLIEKILEAQQPPMTAPMGTGLPLMPRDQGMYTPRQQRDLPRMPKVDRARAANKSPEYTERMQDLLDSRSVRGKVDTLIGKGRDLGMTEWYGTEPLRQVAMDLGRTPAQFESLMAQLASASQRNPVDKQNQMGSYLYHLSETGQLPENSLLLTNKLKKALQEYPSLAEGRQLVELPQGYGSLAQGDIFNRAVMIGQGDIGGALPPNKKLGTFYENLLGNLEPVTVDVNAVRGPIITQGDPRWLTSKLVEKDDTGKVINSYKPREMYESGEMSMREAKQRPGFWEAAPSGSEYAGFEDLWQRGARRHSVKPAEAQALGWYGSADVTALKTKPELYVDNLERLIKRTAEQTGKSPTEVMNDMITGQGFLRKDGGAVTDPHKSFEEHRIKTGHEWVGKETKKADGGLAFKTLDFKSAGGMAGKAEIPVDPDIKAPEKTSSNMDIIRRLFGMGKDQAEEEIESLKKPRAGTDLLNRGVIANLAGAPVDLVNYMGLGSIDALTSLQGNKTKLMQDKPAGGSEYIKDLMDKYGATTGTERPMMELAGAFAGNLPYKAVSGAAKAAQKVGEKAPEYAKKAESGLKSLTSNVARPFTPGTSVIEAVAPDLATFRPKDFQNMVTERLIGDNSPLPLNYIGGKKTTKRSAQGVYGNDAGQLETNPMVAVDIPGIGAFDKNPAFRSDIASAGKALNQEAMAVHRFVPMFPNNIKDASAMLIKPKGGKLTNEEVIALGERLGNMVVAHNPRLGGVVVYPFDEVKKGVIPSEFLDAQSVANSVLGKRADIKYGVADYKKDRMFITRGEYADEGAREPSAQILAERKRLKKQEARAFPSPKPSSGLNQMQQLGTSTTR